MKFPLSWLKQYLDTQASVEELAAKLNAIGLEVEGIENPAEKLAGFASPECSPLRCIPMLTSCRC
jgi:phenylalanyl-tRNA synthetase beta chain